MSQEVQDVLDALPEEKQDELYTLINDYWIDYWEQRRNPKVAPYIVDYSIPIIWFGDINEYWKSDLKVVTVGINPSDSEFLTNEKKPEDRKPSYSRFGQTALDLKDCPSLGNKDSSSMKILIEAYNNYFKTDPYEYFYKFDRPLQNFPEDKITSYVTKDYKDKLYKGKGTRIYRETDYRAIHIDCKTALATKKLWSHIEDKVVTDQLSKESQDKIDNGVVVKVGLFNRLLNILQPQIILVSEKGIRDDLMKECKNSLYNTKELRSVIIKGDPSKKNSKFERISYERDSRLWIYGKNNTVSPFLLPTEKNKNAKNEEHSFFKEALKDISF